MLTPGHGHGVGGAFQICTPFRMLVVVVHPKWHGPLRLSLFVFKGLLPSLCASVLSFTVVGSCPSLWPLSGPLFVGAGLVVGALAALVVVFLSLSVRCAMSGRISRSWMRLRLCPSWSMMSPITLGFHFGVIHCTLGSLVISPSSLFLANSTRVAIAFVSPAIFQSSGAYPSLASCRTLVAPWWERR